MTSRLLMGTLSKKHFAGLLVGRAAAACRAFSSKPERIGVIGAGQMSTGIAIVAAKHAESQVTVFGNSAAGLVRSQKFVDDWVAKEVSKEKMSAEEGKSVAGRIKFGALKEISEELGQMNFIIEGVAEDLDIKKGVFELLDEKCPKETILATNTSSLSITKIASFTKRPEKVVGMHFMNPVPVMKGLELIRGIATSNATLEATQKLSAAMGKSATTCQKDVPGFLVNRVLMPMINEAIYTLDEGVMTKEDIDKSMTLCAGFPMGPLTLGDFIGLDTCLAIMRVLHEELGDSKYRPAPLLVTYVNAGWLGKKTKRGFFTY